MPKTKPTLLTLLALTILITGGYLGYQQIIKPQQDSIQITEDRVKSLPLINDQLSWLASSSTNITALNSESWKTYELSDKGYNITLDYPSNWVAQRQVLDGKPDAIEVFFSDPKSDSFFDCYSWQSSNKDDINLTDSEKLQCDQSYSLLTDFEQEELSKINYHDFQFPIIYLVVSENPTNLGLKDWLIKQFRGYGSGVNEIEDFAPVKATSGLADREAYFSDISCCDVPDFRYSVKSEGKIISLGIQSLSSSTDDAKNYLNLFASKLKLNN